MAGGAEMTSVLGGSGFQRAPALRRRVAPDAAAVRALYVDDGRNMRQVSKQLGISAERVEASLREAGIVRRDARRACPVGEVELRRLFQQEKVSARGLARRWGSTVRTVNRWLAEAGLIGPSGSFDVEELRRLYVEQKLPTREVARRLGCSVTTAKTAIERAGITRRVSGADQYSEHRAAITEEDLQRVYVQGGRNLKDAAEELGVSVNWLRKRLAQAGLAKRPGTHTPHTPYARAELRQKSAALYEAGASIRAVAAELGVGYSAVRVALHQAGVPIRRGGSSQVPEDAAPRLLVEDLYADPAVVACLRRHRVAIPELSGWQAAGPTQTLAPLPLSPALVRELYEALGLAMLHITMLCGVGMGSVSTALEQGGVTRRPMHAPSPWLARTYGAAPGGPPPA